MIYSIDQIREMNLKVYSKVLRAKVGDILTLYPKGKDPPWLYNHAGISRDYDSNQIRECLLNFSAKCFVLEPGTGWHWVLVDGKEGYISSLDVVDVKESNLKAFI